MGDWGRLVRERGPWLEAAAAAWALLVSAALVAAGFWWLVVGSVAVSAVVAGLLVRQLWLDGRDAGHEWEWETRKLGQRCNRCGMTFKNWTQNDGNNLWCRGRLK
jgi:fatty acid desaturase